MKINYSPKRTITTADLYDATNPPLIFEVRTRPTPEWARLDRIFGDEGAKDPIVARELISMVFLSVSDGENTYPLDSVEAVEALQAAIEENNPSCGDQFSCNIAWSFGINHYNRLQDNLGNSLEPLLQSSDNGKVKIPA